MELIRNDYLCLKNIQIISSVNYEYCRYLRLLLKKINSKLTINRYPIIDILGHEMKKRIKKLLYSSLAAFISIIVNFDTEARVTREVAEAVLPYLMKAAKIPEDPPQNKSPSPPSMATTTSSSISSSSSVSSSSSLSVTPTIPNYSKAKKRAIIDMIYTDEGQQQMVKWVKNGEFPDNFKEKFISSNTYKDEKYRKATLSSLFPCQTDTFTSFANHQSRLGLHILSNDLKKSEYITQFLQQQNIVDKVIGNISFQSFEEANRSFHSKNRKSDPVINLPIDVLLAKVIFVLDIIDDKNILSDVLRNCGVNVPSFEDMRNNAEYTVRPSPAIVAENIMGKLDGDCVETLYRHLINIAIHDYGTNKFHIERLPAELRKYYAKTDKYFNEFKDNLGEAPGLELFQSEAGRTNIEKHKSWKICLQNAIMAMFQTRIGSDFYNEIICSQEMSNFCISIGSITYVSRILHEIAFFNTPDKYLDKNLFGDDRNKLLIKNAMNKLANAKNRFEVNIVPREEDDPAWVNKAITIKDSSSAQKIRVGLQTNGHAEIIKIETSVK